MKLTKATIISLLAMSFVLAGVLIAGCTQDNSNAAPAANSPSSANGGSPSGMYGGNANYGNHPNFMQNVLRQHYVAQRCIKPALEYLNRTSRMPLHRLTEVA